MTIARWLFGYACTQYLRIAIPRLKRRMSLLKASLHELSAAGAQEVENIARVSAALNERQKELDNSGMAMSAMRAEINLIEMMKNPDDRHAFLVTLVPKLAATGALNTRLGDEAREMRGLLEESQCRIRVATHRLDLMGASLAAHQNRALFLESIAEWTPRGAAASRDTAARRLPGMRARALIAQLYSSETVALTFDPVLADIHHSWEAAGLRGASRLSLILIRLHGYVRLLCAVRDSAKGTWWFYQHVLALVGALAVWLIKRLLW